MRFPLPLLRHLASASMLLGWLSAPAAAQLIPIKTLPLATGEQFLIHPSARLGTGGTRIAVRDTLLDPFVNPARGAEVDGALLFGAPALYLVSDGLGDGRTLPVGVLAAGERWFGGASAALQQIDPADRPGVFGGDVLSLSAPPPSRDRLSERSSNNLYTTGLLGRRLGDGRTALAVGASYAALGAVDGVDLLYARSEHIAQDGSMADLRLGLTRRLPGEQDLELLLLHSRIDMVHDVSYRDWRWDPITRRSQATSRTEHHEDRTRTWGAHLGYVRPMGEAGWRVGGILTGNFKTHPKIPNYEIMNIPRDPGTTWAYNLGIGLARTDGPATLAVDIVYEPIWSETWAEADTALVSAKGRTIAAGERTVDNDFRFHNAALRLGVQREVERYGFQLGLEARSYTYRLRQDDHVLERKRTQDESWMEWTPTWSVGLFFPELRVRYSGRLTTGTGRPGVDVAPTIFRAGAASLAADFVVAPSGPLTLREARVIAHQVTVTVPIGRRAAVLGR